jgi:TonB-dependent receptor
MRSNLLFSTKSYLIILVLIGFSTILHAQTIKGNVTDAKSGETLIGATVHIQKDNFQSNTTVKLDGTYQFKNIPAGTYELSVKFIGYKTTKEYAVDAKQRGTTVLNVSMLSNETVLKEVAVIESVSKETDNSARKDEKNASNTMNVVSANSIAISPDVIVSNVVSRISGVSIDRSNNGDAQHVIIRGMDKKYNTTLINGVKIPSPDNKNRFVPLDIFPADLVERIEISKSLTPDMEADASGGVVNMVMKTAPDHLRIEGNFGTGYSQLFFDRPFSSFNAGGVNSKAPGEFLQPLAFASPSSFPYNNLLTTQGNPPPNSNVSLTIGDRFLNKKLGVLFSGTFQNTYAGNNTFMLPQTGVVGPAPSANSQMVETAFQDEYLRKYSSQIDRTGLITSLDYKFDKNNTITLFGTFIQLNEHRVRQTEDFNFGGYSYNGYVGTNGIDNLTETRSDLQSILNATLKGDHKINDFFKFDWTIANSKASHQLPDVAEFDTKYKTSPGTGGTYAHTPGGGPQDQTYLAPSVVNDSTRVGAESRLWRRNTDNDIAAYLNLHFDTKIFGRRALFGFGGMFRHKTRSAFNDSYSLTAVPDPGTNSKKYISIPNTTFYFAPDSKATGSSFSDAGVYSFYENIQGGYGELKYFINNKLDVIFGLRAESTLQHFASSGNPALGGNYGTITYIDFLPSINAKYALTDIQALRASYFQSVYRPTAADIIPFADVTQEGFSTIGNPNLQHTVVDNYDLRYEAFPGALDEFMIGGFYKLLTNPIEFQSQKVGATGIQVGPTNLGNAHNYGLEVVAKKFFGSFGVSANYTYTNSLINSTKYFQVVGSPLIQVNQERPLQGQSANVGNFSLLYKNSKSFIDAQLALVYTGDRINTVSLYKDLDTWEKGTVNLDFSVQKAFNKRYIFYVKVNNILNTPYQLYIKQANVNNYTGIMKYHDQFSPNYTTVEYDQYYAKYSLGFRFKF